ncbi:MAG: N-formylglutamate deformylase [Rhodobacteraceae bacterium]|nr:N-formylglutamate deformylase [Paracoccaceae bacterium]
MNPVEVTSGESPIILAISHTGFHIPADIETRLNGVGLELADTDWHVEQLYSGLLPGASIVRAMFHRYVIDANRGPFGNSLYPGQNTTGLCPLTDFDGRSIYRPGHEPNAAEIQRRLEDFHEPYHAALSVEIEQAVQRFGVAIVYDCHSIRSRISYLFEGRLPDLNIGTNGGITCDSEIEKLVSNICGTASDFTSITNGRFKGGWTTRLYGQPHENVHTIQMELAQSTYMHEHPPWDYNKEKASRLREVLSEILNSLEQLALSGNL